MLQQCDVLAYRQRSWYDVTQRGGIDRVNVLAALVVAEAFAQLC